MTLVPTITWFWRTALHAEVPPSKVIVSTARTAPIAGHTPGLSRKFKVVEHIEYIVMMLTLEPLDLSGVTLPNALCHRFAAYPLGAPVIRART